MKWGTDLIIRGEGAKAINTKLVGLKIVDYDGYLVIENLAMYGTNGTDEYSSTIEIDEDDGVIFRNSLIYTNNNVDPGIQMYSERIGFINCNISNLVSYPASSSHGYNDDAKGLVMLNTKISGYDIGLNLGSYHWTSSPSRDYKVYNTDLSSNNVPCLVCTDYSTCVNNKTLLALKPNTPAGQKYNVSNFIDILRFKTSYSGDGPYIPVKVYFVKVSKVGETTIYRLPSAYPLPPNLWSSATGDVQYYQFDSTALLSSSPILYFNKTSIDAQFPAGVSIKCFYYNNLGWTMLTTIIVRGVYAVTFPSKTSLTGLLAFLYQ